MTILLIYYETTSDLESQFFYGTRTSKWTLILESSVLIFFWNLKTLT